MPEIRQILKLKIQALSKSPVKFELTPAAMQYNTELFITMEYSLDKLIHSFPSSELAYGSEFQPASILKPILQYQKN